MFKINILKFLFLIICLKILPLFIQDESELRKKRAGGNTVLELSVEYF